LIKEVKNMAERRQITRRVMQVFEPGENVVLSCRDKDIHLDRCKIEPSFLTSIKSATYNNSTTSPRSVTIAYDPTQDRDLGIGKVVEVIYQGRKVYPINVQ